MSLYFSASTGGFYDPAINGSAIPADAVQITSDDHASLLAAQSGGKVIAADATGHPIAVDPPAPPLDKSKAALCASIDASADAAYAMIGGNSPGRMAEYQQAKDDAAAFKAAGYAGTVPATVACWAQAKDWAAQQACDDILATATSWSQALVAIRTARLTGKGNVDAAADVASATAAANAAIASIGKIPASA